VTNTNMCPRGSMLSDMRHLLDGWNIEDMSVFWTVESKSTQKYRLLLGVYK
jgi:hypothetical protein